MTLTFNRKQYKKLLVKYQPKMIQTEEDNEKALAFVEELMHRSKRTPEEDEMYELLITLIEKFEQDYYSPGIRSHPQSMLLFLMEQKDIEPGDLVGIIGSQKTVDDIVNGKGKISKYQAKVLGSFFQVDSSLFM
ncbi:transcriptional regulator [Moorena producens PAL-8-15-08-1]|uniref:Transcriptional regulator n=3 Tax=Moorena TaxID=1155738 RepID=A0A1D8TYZ3_9CYAN|nr:transcriptional regulator [Moorena producens PAL-8-15-08-1]NEO17468.1 transcriptional regulator [Moorena sp. SIO3E8]NEQ04013.1 transcriptional regulator [Moorena sp. SIO3F7]